MNIRQYIGALEQSGYGRSKSVVYAIEIFREALQTPVKNLWKFLTKARKRIVKKYYVVNVKNNVLEKK
ncbi:MAG: hypothetical protein WC933_00110 [Candidatus Paceibacterota bacterium]|jgi:hypothetical protein